MSEQEKPKDDKSDLNNNPRPFPISTGVEVGQQQLDEETEKSKQANRGTPSTPPRQPMSKFERWTIIIGAIGIAVALGTNIYTGMYLRWQFAEMIEGGKQVEKQIKALQDTADAANKGVALAEDTDRPWIGIQSWPNIESIDELGNKTRIVLRFINSGKRPAKVLEANSGLSIGKLFNPIYDANPDLLKRETGQIVLVPGMMTTRESLIYSFRVL